MNPEQRLTVLVDLNVVVDVLTERQPHYGPSSQVWAYVEAGLMRGFLAAHSFTTLHYLLRRHLGAESASRALRDVRTVFEVAPVTQAVIDRAIDLGWHDFEDAVQMAAAEGIGADCVVTRNAADYGDASLPVVHPLDFPNTLRLG